MWQLAVVLLAVSVSIIGADNNTRIVCYYDSRSFQLEGMLYFLFTSLLCA